MNDRTVNDKPERKRPTTTAETTGISHEEMDELKREMQSARIAAWIQSHQKQVVAALTAVILLIVGISFWREHVADRRASAATLYHQALDANDTKQRRALLDKVVSDYGDTAYAGLARLLLASLDTERAADHLKALINDAPDREIRWQAELDLAALQLRKGDQAAARETLNTPVGRDYEQLRQYLLARASATDAERVTHLQKADQAVSHDEELKKKISDWLARLQTSGAAGSAKGKSS